MKDYTKLIKDDPFLKLDNNGYPVIHMPQDYIVIDCHIHMSHVLPGKQKSPEIQGHHPTYPTLPPIHAMDLSVPYWTCNDYLIQKYKSPWSILSYIKEGILILNDMVAGGSYTEYFSTSKKNHVEKSVVLPISTKKNDLSEGALKTACDYPQSFIPFISVHPSTVDGCDKITAYHKQGAKGMKFKLSCGELKKYHDSLVKLLRTCYDLDMPVLFHTGSILNEMGAISKLSSKLLHVTKVQCFKKLLEALPKDFKFIFGHAGIEEFKLVAEYMKEHTGAYAEISCQSTESIKYLIQHVGHERLLFGSDWPALPQAFTLSRVLHATIDNEEARMNILYNNAVKLFKIKE